MRFIATNKFIKLVFVVLTQFKAIIVSKTRVVIIKAKFEIKFLFIFIFQVILSKLFIIYYY